MRLSVSAAVTVTLVVCLAMLAALARVEPVSGAAPAWKLCGCPTVVGEKVYISVRGSDVSGHAEVRLVGVRLPPFRRGQKRKDFQKGGRFWVLERHRPRNIRLLYRGQTVRAKDSIQIDEVEPAIQFHFYFDPKAGSVFSRLGRGTGTLAFVTAAGSVRMRVPVSIVPYGSPG